MRRKGLLLAAPLIVLVMAGCGGPVKDATYENASKLRDAVIASGVDCPGDAVKHDDKYGEDFLKCSDSLAMAVYDKDADMKLAVIPRSMGTVAYLTGTRWVVDGDAGTLAKLKDKLGGSVNIP